MTVFMTFQITLYNNTEVISMYILTTIKYFKTDSHYKKALQSQISGNQDILPNLDSYIRLFLCDFPA